ncbi:hypothetical protein [Agilicoccus flavus]|uniref:hypothetical protein n=1 Tax=Agilicoccus flavus TaxID=2775968 RepID=UPI001CF6E682|nr:hypothetical protein [Agilicoccus flavus]
MNATATTTTTVTNTVTTQAELLALMSFGAPELVSREWADARALEYVMASGCCATCLSDGAGPLPGDDAADLAACPTCGERSVEWTLAQEIDERVAALAGLSALDAALQA